MSGLKDKGTNPYPHKFQSTMQLPHYHAKYGKCADGAQVEAVEGIAGRIMSKRSGGKGLVFYDIHADGFKVQVFADARNFTEFKGDNALVGFMALMNSTKRGDLVGVTGKPGKTKRGELSIFPSSLQILTPCLHMIPKTTYGLVDKETRFRQRYLDWADETESIAFVLRSGSSPDLDRYRQLALPLVVMSYAESEVSLHLDCD